MMTSFYNLLKYAATGIASPDMTYYDRMRASTLMGGGTVQTLTGIPPLSFKSNGTPLISWSMKGNGQQTGTPSPDNIIMPTFCGVRTANVMPAGEKKTVTIRGITFESDGNGRYHVYGTSTGSASAQFNLAYGFTTPISISNGGQGTLSIFNDGDNANVVIAFYNGTEKVDDWRATPKNRTSTAYNAIGNKYIDVVRITVESGETVDMIISPEFTNDGVLPSGFEPFGWAIPISCGGENLFDASLLANNMQLDNTAGLPVSYTGRIASTDPVDVSQYSTVTISYVTATTIKAIYTIFSNDELVGRFTAVSSGTAIDVSNADKMYICFYSTWGGNIDTSSVSDIMLNSGSTPKPYAPYSRQTVPVYLGQTNRTRKILKRVLNGSETWDNTYGTSLFGMNQLFDVPFIPEAEALCTHYAYNPVQSGLDAAMRHGEFALQKTSNQYKLFFKNTDFTSPADFKAWIAAEYAAGHPVTVWYVRETAAFAMVDEPLAKIGDYADELNSEDAAVTIPTIKGSNTLTVDTPIQPSEMTITFKG